MTVSRKSKGTSARISHKQSKGTKAGNKKQTSLLLQCFGDYMNISFKTVHKSKLSSLFTAVKLITKYSSPASKMLQWFNGQM